ncbi:MAG TPA: cupin domain-containing protein [Methanospirillum sp.]|nr:cupin domain-containing protein [Methanospirillum sp.]
MVEDLNQLKGRVLKTDDLIAYQDGSIVSRMITYTPHGTITLFAFAAGSGLSEHTAPFDAVLQIVQGDAIVTLAGDPHMLKTGEMIILPADIPHAVKAETPFKMILTMIHT